MYKIIIFVQIIWTIFFRQEKEKAIENAKLIEIEANAEIANPESKEENEDQKEGENTENKEGKLMI